MSKLSDELTAIDHGDVDDKIRNFHPVPNNINPNHYQQLQQQQQQQQQQQHLQVQQQKLQQYQQFLYNNNNYYSSSSSSLSSSSSSSSNSLNVPNSTLSSRSISPSLQFSPSPMNYPKSPNQYNNNNNNINVNNNNYNNNNSNNNNYNNYNNNNNYNYNYNQTFQQQQQFAHLPKIENTRTENTRTYSQESLADPFLSPPPKQPKPVGIDPLQPISVQLQHFSNNQPALNRKKSSPTMRNDNSFEQTVSDDSRKPPLNHQKSSPVMTNVVNPFKDQNFPNPIITTTTTTISTKTQLASPNNNKKSSPITRNVNPFKDSSESLLLPKSPLTADDYVTQAIKFHEEDKLEKSTEYFRIAAEKGSQIGMFFYGIALRHGWGCEVNAAQAFNYLSKVANMAKDAIEFGHSVTLKNELVLAVYELGNCFRHGWGVQKNKSTAAYYYEIAAKLGDPDAQNEIGHCYYKGEGVKKDMKTAAKYYRMAHEQGCGTMGNSWIFKEKYT